MIRHRKAFTLIEVLVSVLILSGAIVYILNVYNRNHEQILYIAGRNAHALEDSLFLSTESLDYHKSEKNAYDILRQSVKIDDFDSRKALKSVKRSIFIPESIRIVPEEETEGTSATIDKIMLKGDYSSIYYHFKMNSF